MVCEGFDEILEEAFAFTHLILPFHEEKPSIWGKCFFGISRIQYQFRIKESRETNSLPNRLTPSPVNSTRIHPLKIAPDYSFSAVGSPSPLNKLILIFLFFCRLFPISAWVSTPFFLQFFIRRFLFLVLLRVICLDPETIYVLVIVSPWFSLPTSINLRLLAVFS